MPVKFFDFNSRPSARGDVSDCSIADISTISIHAPPRGATSHPVIFPSAALFQFTPLREGRQIPYYNAQQTAMPISIHAPPRGATTSDFANIERKIISIHAPPRGATHHATCKARKERYFNSRPSARGDNREQASGRVRKNFNSRPSARGDFAMQPKSSAILFQFTPLREGRRK